MRWQSKTRWHSKIGGTESSRGHPQQVKLTGNGIINIDLSGDGGRRGEVRCKGKFSERDADPKDSCSARDDLLTHCQMTAVWCFLCPVEIYLTNFTIANDGSEMAVKSLFPGKSKREWQSDSSYSKRGRRFCCYSSFHFYFQIIIIADSHVPRRTNPGHFDDLLAFDRAACSARL